MGIHNDNSKNLRSSSYITHSNVIRVPGIGFKLTSDGNYYIDNKQLKNIKDGTDDSDAINKSQMESHIRNGDLDIQGTINIRRGAISIDGTNSQISAADLNKLFESNYNISGGKIPIYSNDGYLFCDKVKMRFSNNFIYLKPNQQSGNATLQIPDLNGQNETIAFKSYIDKKEEKVRGFIEKGGKNVIFGSNSTIYFHKNINIKNHIL